MGILGPSCPLSRSRRRTATPLHALRFSALLAVGLALTFAVVACGGVDGGVRGSGTAASEIRDVEPFTNLRIKGAADVSISIGEPQSLMVETDDNLLELLDTDVSGDTLEIEFRDRASPRVGVDVAITVPRLEGVRVDGAAEIDIDEMAGGELEIAINGAAAVRASGSVDYVDVDVNGTAGVELFDLVAEEVDVSIAGSGNAEVHVRRSLSATITGSGHIVYEGDPGDVATSITGSGTIEAR